MKKGTFRTMLSRMECDKIVRGIFNREVQNPLLARSKLTLTEAEDLLIAAETGARDVHGMQQHDKPVTAE